MFENNEKCNFSYLHSEIIKKKTVRFFVNKTQFGQ